MPIALAPPPKAMNSPAYFSAFDPEGENKRVRQTMMIRRRIVSSDFPGDLQSYVSPQLTVEVVFSSYHTIITITNS
jgi:hypothetical protein